MASRAILRRKRFIPEYINASYRSIQSFHILGPEHHNSHNVQPPYANHKRAPSVTKHQLSEIAQFRREEYHGSSLLFAPLGIRVRWMSISIRNASTAAAAAAKQQESGSDDEQNEELLNKKRKEASPEECDQAVEGLTTVKAKAKAKKLQEQKAANSILRKTWTTFLGIGPALRAVASMSKLDSLSLSNLGLFILFPTMFSISPAGRTGQRSLFIGKRRLYQHYNIIGSGLSSYGQM